MNENQELILRHTLATTLQHYIKGKGVTPPEGTLLVLEEGVIDTEGKTLVFNWDYVSFPTDPEEEDDE